MTHEQAEFFRDKLLPIVRESAVDDDRNTQNPNPLSTILRQVIRYAEYLECEVARLSQEGITITETRP